MPFDTYYFPGSTKQYVHFLGNQGSETSVPVAKQLKNSKARTEVTANIY